MKGHTQYISSFLPKDLINDLLITEEDISTVNEEASETIHNPRRCISEETINSKFIEFFNNQSNSTNSTSTLSSLNDVDFTLSSRKSSTLPQRKTPFIFEHEVEYNNLTLKQFLQIPKNQMNLASIINNCAGSHFLQKMIKTVESSDIDLILSLLEQNMKCVMCDSYGNYFIQKIIAKCSKAQRLILMAMIEKDFYEIANDISGTHCLQCIVDIMNSKEEEEIIKNCIQNDLLDLAISQNSTHIIQKLIVKQKLLYRNYLVNFCITNFVELSLNLNGSAIIKKLIEELSSLQLMQMILSIIEINYVTLVENQFGNFVIQKAIDIFGYKNCEKLMINILTNAVYFSLQKYSSNVIDKIAICLNQNNKLCFERLISVLILTRNNLNILSQNKYGMYVLGNLVKLLSSQEKKNISHILINQDCALYYYSNINNSNRKLSKFLCLLD